MTTLDKATCKTDPQILEPVCMCVRVSENNHDLENIKLKKF